MVVEWNATTRDALVDLSHTPPRSGFKSHDRYRKFPFHIPRDYLYQVFPIRMLPWGNCGSLPSCSTCLQDERDLFHKKKSLARWPFSCDCFPSHWWHKWKRVTSKVSKRCYPNKTSFIKYQSPKWKIPYTQRYFYFISCSMTLWPNIQHKFTQVFDKE